ncbi:protein-ADP-ribose hydrolase [uncultured Parolsenella sp.]|uniref:protein-ADP-ribose hydrolase n=1 Tax=uncultured Parolsenella sp. TaxID=2083008 RepID=UPI0025FAB3B1|nr:protein-ADP-ribose hydrolase [uncultured Parolsenella sp.]
MAEVRTPPMNQSERRLFLIETLLAERPDGTEIAIPAGADDQRRLLRALMNVRPPEPLAPEVLAIQDAYLAQRLIERGGATQIDTLAFRDRIAVWRGDITLLAADAIVNAANDQMLGCFVPGHSCIDNAIHTYAGMQLREVCAQLMDAQGHAEPTGRVKVTPAYNLPSRCVFHTVGPIVPSHNPGPREELLLRRCYESCLVEASRRGLDNIAFCCISTGVFGYPQKAAARVATEAVRRHLSHNDSRLKVVFDVFLPDDEAIYQELVSATR